MITEPAAPELGTPFGTPAANGAVPMRLRDAIEQTQANLESMLEFAENLLLFLKGQVAQARLDAAEAVAAAEGEADAATDALAQATQNALNLKAPLANPTFTGSVKVPSPVLGTEAANRSFVEALTALLAPKNNPTFTGKVNLPPVLSSDPASTAVDKGWLAGQIGDMATKTFLASEFTRRGL